MWTLTIEDFALPLPQVSLVAPKLRPDPTAVNLDERRLRNYENS